jgi:hypothetical protein
MDKRERLRRAFKSANSIVALEGWEPKPQNGVQNGVRFTSDEAADGAGECLRSGESWPLLKRPR